MSVELKTRSINGVPQMRCPYEYKDYTADIRIGSTWCVNCPRFISKSNTKKDIYDHIYELTVVCNAES